jgi:IS30 family transposase
VAEGESIRSMAARLGRAIDRKPEIRRNGGQGTMSHCGPGCSGPRAPSHAATSQNRTLTRIVTDKLVAGHPNRSPTAQAAYPHDENHAVTRDHLPYPFIQARGALKKELLQHLRRTCAMRRSRHHTQKTEIHG